MTACPDWRVLAAYREARNGAEPSGWGEALAHLDGCPACRREAYAVDPTLLFSRLAAAVPKPGPASEVEDMRRAVAALRRAARVAPAAPVPPVARTVVPWLRAAAGVALLAGLLSLGPADGQGAATSGAPAAGAVPAAFASEDLSRLPVFEGLDRPGRADVYELASDDLLVVMIVDETLDV